MTVLYRYYKGHEKKGVWRSVEITEQEGVESKEHIGFGTVLACTESVGAGQSVSPDVKHQGPFYIDIDDNDIKKSIRAGKTVLKKLEAMGIPENAMFIWASGKRGFHFLIPQEYFTTPRPIAKLPLAYKMMAIALSLPEETDMSVYNMGRGRMWRIANKKRIDTGTYKVPISAAELRSMTAEILADLVAAPRERPAMKPFVGRIPALTGLFELSLGKAEHFSLPSPVFIDAEARKELGDALLPPCSEILLSGKGLNQKKGFNDLSMQMAKAVAAFAPKDHKELIAEFARNAPGDKYNTQGKRESHCTTAFRIATRDTNYAWSCKSALSVIREQPCADCPVAYLRMEQDGTADSAVPDEVPVIKVESGRKSEVKPEPAHGAFHTAADGTQTPIIVISRKKSLEDKHKVIQTEETLAADTPKAPKVKAQVPSAEKMKEEKEKLKPKSKAKKEEVEDEDDLDEPPSSYNAVGLLITDEGYGFMEKGYFRRICNFTLKITEYYIEYIENMQEDRRTGVKADVIIDKRRVGSVLIEDNGWTKGAFISAFSGLSNAAFYGKDDDTQKMKEALMQGVEADSQLVRRVHAAGIHREEIAGDMVFTYVEPGWSINQYGQENRYKLTGTIDYSPDLQHATIPEKGDKALEEVLRRMMDINSEINIAQMFGWMMACFLKQHVYAYKKEFPLLGVHGNRGSGKTKGLEMLATLHGRTYHSGESPINLPSVTPFVLWSTAASSTTFPMIMDEMNRYKVKHFDAFCEVFKDVYQAGSVKRGALDTQRGAGASKSGARIQDFPLLAPCAITSEQMLVMPALEQRTIQVALRPADLRQGTVKDSYNYVRRNFKLLKGFAKAAYLKAVNTKVETVRDWQESFEPLISQDLPERTHFSYTVILTGLKFFEEVCLDLGLNLGREVRALRDCIIQNLELNGASIAESKNRSEIDIVLDKMALLAAMPETDNFSLRLAPNVHYLLHNGYLYLDGVLCFANYQRYTNQVDRVAAPISDFINFRSLITNEPYCVTTKEVIPDFAKGRPLIKLDMRALAAKGIDTAAFTEQE